MDDRLNAPQSPPLRVAVTVEYLHARGGTQRQALELARALIARGAKVEVFARVADLAVCFPELTRGLTIHIAEPVARPNVLHSAGGQGVARRAIRFFLHVTGLTYLWAHFHMRRVTKSWLVSMATPMNAFRPDVINPHDFGPAIWAAVKEGARRGVPVVWQCNDPLLKWTYGVPLTARPLRALAIAFDRIACRGTAVITVLDARVGDVVGRRYGIPVKVTPSGANVAAFAQLPDRGLARKRFGLPPVGPVFLVLTLLNSPHRRTEDAITAFSLSSSTGTLFLVAPSQPENDYVEQIRDMIATSRARDRIVWYDCALKSDDDLREIFAASDALVFPNDQQTWGLAVLEAAAAGLVPVVSRGAGCSDILRDGETGLLFDAMDTRALAALIDKLSNNSALAARIGDAARREIKSAYTWDQFAGRMAEQFKKAVALCAE